MAQVSVLTRLRNFGRLLFGPKKRAPVVSPGEARRMMEGGAVVIDVRQAGEYRGGHIPGARNVPLAEIESRLAEIPRDTPVVLHCALGSRSALAAKRLTALGYENVHDMSGGIREWKKADLPVRKDP